MQVELVAHDFVLNERVVRVEYLECPERAESQFGAVAFGLLVLIDGHGADDLHEPADVLAILRRDLQIDLLAIPRLGNRLGIAALTVIAIADTRGDLDGPSSGAIVVGDERQIAVLSGD